METATPATSEPASIVPRVLELTHSILQSAVKAAHEFLDWQRTTMYGEPDANTRLKHRQTLKLLLRLMRFLHTQAADPDYPDRRAAEELEAVIWKLNQSWEQFYDPMRDSEAEKILRECFPGYGS